MNRLEKIIEELEEAIVRTDNDIWVVEVNKPRIEFLKWLLEESNELPIYEFHTGKVTPTVWGMGDVSYDMSIQLSRFKAYSNPVVFVVGYPVRGEGDLS